MTTILILTILFLLISIFLNIYLIKKGMQYQDVVDTYDEIYDFISQRILYSGRRLKELDVKGHFESDDEIGFFFTEIKNIQTLLDEFNKNYLSETEIQE